jgi:hypothetical protein
MVEHLRCSLPFNPSLYLKKKRKDQKETLGYFFKKEEEGSKGNLRLFF